VARAGNPTDPEARAALEALCRDYWYPLYAFVRRQGLGADDAGDVVQGFLADLIERGALAGVDRDRGRFRAFLRAACSHYLAHRRDHDRAAKRGGSSRPVPIDVLDAEGRYGREPAHELTAERLFERRWALALLENVLAGLEAEADRAGKTDLFNRLRPMLEGDDHGESYREVGAALAMSEGAVKVAAHRMRALYQTRLREEVARTVADPADVDAELGELIAALAG
jgi:RNA polymerase sigma-70 factor (ECF subfamily)